MNIVESAYGAVPAFRADGLLGGEIELPELLGEVMTRAGIGLILAAHGGEILYANDMANELLRASDGLRCERSSLTIQDTASSRKLQPLILAASRRQEEMASGGTVILRGGGAAPPLVLHVIPLDARFSKDSAAGPQPAAGILIVDGQRAFAARTGAFACLFALTPGEARVAAKLFSGEGIKKAASSLNIALSTAQSHLKHILEKTATHRQAELVKLFYQVTLPAGAARSATLERATGLRASASKALWSGIGRRDRAAAGGPGLRAPFPCRAPLSSAFAWGVPEGRAALPGARRRRPVVAHRAPLGLLPQLRANRCRRSRLLIRRRQQTDSASLSCVSIMLERRLHKMLFLLLTQLR